MLSADFTRRQLIAFLDELRFGFCAVFFFLKMYDQLEGEVEAGQSVLSKMPELIIAYEKLEEEKDRTKTETELVKESYQLTAGEIFHLLFDGLDFFNQ
jgi:hypothetical protein